jgi:hypothetical protein
VVTARAAVGNRTEIPIMSPKKLTDTQLVLLSAAAQREDDVRDLKGLGEFPFEMAEVRILPPQPAIVPEVSACAPSAPRNGAHGITARIHMLVRLSAKISLKAVARLGHARKRCQ